MLTLPPSVKIYLSVQPVDMRKSFDGLATQVQSVLEEDPLSGHLFAFFNRRGDIAKILWWSSGGLCLYCKRLERGRFRWRRPADADATHVEMDAADLAMLLEGIDLMQTRRQSRWSRRRAA